LIEAMTAGIVLSILIFGLMNVWVTAGASVNNQVVREKAIWARNGYMERLVALYQFTDFGGNGISNSNDYGEAYIALDHPEINCKIFGVTTNNSTTKHGTTMILFKYFSGN
jgi:hypothetical protein